MTYRDRLARKGIRPVVIERTVKAPGDKVLQTWARAAEVFRAEGFAQPQQDTGA